MERDPETNQGESNMPIPRKALAVGAVALIAFVALAVGTLATPALSRPRADARWCGPAAANVTPLQRAPLAASFAKVCATPEFARLMDAHGVGSLSVATSSLGSSGGGPNATNASSDNGPGGSAEFRVSWT